MSLIQDALKRKAEEAAGGGSVTAEKSAEKSHQPMMIVLTFLLLIGLITALVGLSFYLMSKPEPTAKTAVIQQPVPGVVEPTNAAPVVVAPKPVAPVVVAPTKPVVPVVVEPTPVAPVEAVVEPMLKFKKKWPELKLSGIAQTGGQKLALLNGKMIAVGRTIEDVTVIEVNKGHIVIEYGGERRILYINE